MNIKEYISFIHKGGEPVNELQYVARHVKEHYEGNPEALRTELWHYYYMGFFVEEKLSRKFRFLDFHLQSYAGDSRDFIYFVKQSPYGIPHDVLDFYFRLHLEDRFVEMVSEWLETVQEKSPARALGSTAALNTPGLPANVGSIRSSAPLPPSDDDRLQVMRNNEPVDASEIRAWFRKELLDRTYNRMPVISSEDFETFLFSAFAAFEGRATITVDNKLEVNADGAFLKNVMYRFYKEFRKSSKDKSLREGLALMLKNTFRLFKDQELTTISLSMHRHYSAK